MTLSGEVTKTFWLGAADKPHCALEALAAEARTHTHHEGARCALCAQCLSHGAHNIREAALRTLCRRSYDAAA